MTKLFRRTGRGYRPHRAREDEETPMTTPNSPLSAPLGAAAITDLTDNDDDVNRDTGPTVGASDAEADAARSGSDDTDLDDASRDSDGVPIGSADAEADAENSGADRG
jgi:hypothetical protein